jgi:hypothetical protein
MSAFRVSLNRFRIESVLAVLSGALAVLTIFWPDWIEAFGWDPDNGSGGVERLVVAGLFATALVCGLDARTQWRARARAGG